MAEKPFGIDVSRWQGNINWDAVAINEKKVLFTGIRATISWGYVDSWFNRNWAEAKRVGIARAAYHILYPGVSAKNQMDNFLKVVGDDFGELPLVLDVELSHNKSPQEITNTILQCSSIIEAKTDQKPIIYSRASFIDRYVTGSRSPGAWLNQYDWWLAHYLRSGEEHNGPPSLPKGVSRNRVIIHQTSPSGQSFGVESKALDYNRWQFNEEHFNNYIKRSRVVPMAEKIELLWNAHPELHPK
jgi:GH25 family lysozyme M1 (1,4-beta-N-acetylmuramidase)